MSTSIFTTLNLSQITTTVANWIILEIINKYGLQNTTDPQLTNLIKCLTDTLEFSTWKFERGQNTISTAQESSKWVWE